MKVDPHSLVGAFAMACLSIGAFILLHVLSEWQERKDKAKRERFDLDG